MPHTISIELTDEAYERLKQSASAVQTSVEVVGADNLEVMLGLTEKLDAEDFSRLSDDALKVIVSQRFDAEKDARLRGLTEQTSHTKVEAEEIDRLIHEYDLWILRRTYALDALFQRGYDIGAMLRRN